MMNKGILIIISAPSGCGKDTIINEIVERMQNEAFVSVSMTTRSPRVGEVDGVHYYFVSKDEFEKNIESGEILEYTNYSGNYYGTPTAPVKKLLSEGKVVIFNIEVEGGESIKKIFPDACKIFIVPPSLEVLEHRLRSRGTDDEAAILKRLSAATDELSRACEYDYIVKNDVLEDAVDDVMAIIRAERLKIYNNKNIVSEVIKNA